MPALEEPLAPCAPKGWRGACIDRFDARLGAPGFRWEGQVAAVFETAALAALEPPGPDADRQPDAPVLLSLLGPSRPLLPWSLRLPRGLERLSPGTPVRVQEKVLWICSQDATEGVERHALSGEGLCLSAAGLPCERSAARPTINARLATLPCPRRTLALLGRQAPEGTPLERLATTKATAGLKALLAILFTEPTGEALLAAARRLSGLGPGSTPTGDDLLVGCAAAAWTLRGAGLLPERRLGALRHCLDRLPAACTTPTAREMLREAAGGHFAEPLLGLVQLLVRRDTTTPALATATGALLALGHLSGADLLAGALALSHRATARTPDCPE